MKIHKLEGNNYRRELNARKKIAKEMKIHKLQG